LEQASGKQVTLQKMAFQPGDVEKTYADISKARQMLDYRPATKIEEGIARFISWYENSRVQ
jgi:UDP-glucuronate 4-epimerase